MLRRGLTRIHGGLQFQFHLQFHKSLVLYSTASPSVASQSVSANHFMVDYLVTSLGFPRDEALAVLSTARVSPSLKSTERPQLVVHFLRHSGFDVMHIRKLFAGSPNLLFSDVAKTLDPKIRVFQELGFSGSNLGLIISNHPSILCRSLKAHIIPALSILKSVLGSDEQVVSFLLKNKSQKLLSINVLKYLRDNLLLLQSYGIPSERLKQFILRRPLFLFQRTKWVEKTVKETEGKLGIPRTSGMFLRGMAALSMTSDKKIESFFEVLRSYGWSQAQILSFTRKQPFNMTLSEETLRVKLKYLMHDSCFGPDYLMRHPVLLGLNIEKKIIPRTAVLRALKENQLLKRDVSAYTVVIMTESKFLETYVLLIKYKLPELFEYYTRTTGVPLA